MSKAVEQRLKKQVKSICNNVNATDNTEISPTAYAVETPKGEHPLLQSKRLSPAVNYGPGRPTDSPWLLLYAVLITTIPLLAIYISGELSRLLWHFLTHGGEMNAEDDGTFHSFQANWRFSAM